MGERKPASISSVPSKQDSGRIEGEHASWDMEAEGVLSYNIYIYNISIHKYTHK
jgi:hypothetical protein